MALFAKETDNLSPPNARATDTRKIVDEDQWWRLVASPFVSAGRGDPRKGACMPNLLLLLPYPPCCCSG